MRMFIVIFMTFLINLSVSGQSSSYSGQQERDIKALSPAEKKGYLAGKGMGFAKAAELNGYPGPKHVLDLSEELSLTEEQTTKTRQLFKSMKEEAVALGEELVSREKQLDRLFVDEDITREALNSPLLEIGSLKAKIRYVHIKSHLRQKEILNTKQVKKYNDLRGYTSGEANESHHHHTH